MKRRRKWARSNTAWEKFMKQCDRYIDRRVSVTGKPRKEIKEAVLWRFHLNGYKHPSYSQYKLSHMSIKGFKNVLRQEIKKFKYSENKK